MILRRLLVVLSLGLLFFIGGGSGCLKERSAHADCIQTPDQDCRPEIRGQLFNGSAFDSATLKGKVVLVNFWATWCGPCQKEIPALETVFARHEHDGFTIVGLVSGDRAGDDFVRNFTADHDMTYPTMRSTVDMERMFNTAGLLPASYLYDRQGRLRGKWTGGIDEEPLEQQVQALLRE